MSLMFNYQSSTFEANFTLRLDFSSTILDKPPRVYILPLPKRFNWDLVALQCHWKPGGFLDHCPSKYACPAGSTQKPFKALQNNPDKSFFHQFATPKNPFGPSELI
eukprot:CAMPEP_0184040302 /NCGR_PEP_ID=MMETSP0955-20130417/57165_1 /TAXON_ID=627963 /ORGANISM="Aplanochytrium sp, Strain PBS07" /LENGTH=105 /DNA_ID=CAMNT_0026330013 /DNA_START=20 /DNA_END=334 /DNA_ORIENTATION=-